MKVGRDPRYEGKGWRRDGRQVLDGRVHPARVASDGRAPGSRGQSTGDIIPFAALPDFWTKSSESKKSLTIAAAQTAARPRPTRNFAGSGDSLAAGHAEQHLLSASRYNAERACARG